MIRDKFILARGLQLRDCEGPIVLFASWLRLFSIHHIFRQIFLKKKKVTQVRKNRDISVCPGANRVLQAPLPERRL